MRHTKEQVIQSAPIGVFDSGLGGLTLVRELRRQLPSESIVYFGDIARLPYGTKSREQIKRFSFENSEFLMTKGIKALVIACNSSSSAAYQVLKRHYRIPVIDVISPAVEAACRVTHNRRIGVIGTHATIESRAYEKALLRKLRDARIISAACPLFVPLVEEGMLETSVTADMVAHYLEGLKGQRIDTLILGCTHYPMLRRQIQTFLGKKTLLIDSASPCISMLARLLGTQGRLNAAKRRGKLEIYVSDLPRNFIRVGEKFLEEKLKHVKVVR